MPCFKAMIAKRRKGDTMNSNRQYMLSDDSNLYLDRISFSLF